MDVWLFVRALAIKNRRDFITQKRFVKKKIAEFRNLEQKNIEYKFSVKHFLIWCYKCDTMFFVDRNKANFIHIS
jgi:hypothetical protein